MAAKKKPSVRSSTATSAKKKPVEVKAVVKHAAAKKPSVRSTKRKTTKATPAITDDQIAKRAYELWLGYGRPIGRDQMIWLQAERELNSKA